MSKLSRRSFLRALAAGGAAAAAGCSTPVSFGGYIDAHVHVWPPDTSRYPLVSGMSKVNLVDSFTPEQLLAQCRPEGVARIVLIQMSFFGFDNRYMLDAIVAHPGVFSGVGIVNEQEAGVSQRMKELARGGVKGFRIHAGKEKKPEKWLASPGMAELWHTAADEGLSVCPLIGPEALPALGQMCAKYPQTSVVVDHFARVGASGSIKRPDLDQLLSLSQHPRVHVKASAFYALGAKQPPYLDLGLMIRECRDAFGARRLMWASDCPFQLNPGHTYHDSIALIRDQLDFLSAEDKAWLLRRTAEAVFWS